jgi:hypothetical protein
VEVVRKALAVLVVLLLSIVSLAMAKPDMNMGVFHIIITAGYSEGEAIFAAHTAGLFIEQGYPAALFTSTASRYLIRDNGSLNLLYFVWETAMLVYGKDGSVGKATQAGLDIPDDIPEEPGSIPL